MLSGDARELNSVRFPRKNGFFSPARPGPAFSPEIRLIGSLQPLRSETPESVRRAVNVELHGGSCAAVKIKPRKEGGGAGGKRRPMESTEKIILL